MLRNISYLLLVVAVISMVVLSACSSKQTEKLTDVEKEGIQYIYEVEKVARDVYQYFYDKWETPVQNIISGSEQSHMDIMKELIDKYDLGDPAEGNDYGEFSNSDLQQLYHDLTELGLSSEVDALSTAAMIEEFDIVEIRKYTNNTDRDDIISAYNKLVAGSESHLRIFVAKLKDQGVEYQPQYLSQQDYNQIIATVPPEITTTTTISPSEGATFSELAMTGEQSYSGNCFNCHGVSLSTGPASNVTLSKYQNAQNLLEKISGMPSSGEQEQWEVLSYILLEHDWVSGTTIFNVDTLSQILLSQ
ncbi:DUF2202 domain-containing protein [Chloroflexota bacterium]